MNEVLNKNETTTDIYLLTDCQQKLLEVLVNPEHHGKNVLEKCKIAGISRDSYYRIMKDTNFIKVLNEVTLDLLKGRVSEIVNATISHALKDPKCHSDRKMLLELINVYKERQQIDINPDGPIQAAIMQMSDVEIMEKIKEFTKTHPEIIQKIEEN